MNPRFRRFSSPFENNDSTDTSADEKSPYTPAPQPAEPPMYNPVEQPQPPQQEVPPSVFVPEIEFKPVSKPTVDPSDDGSLHNDAQDSGFYGSYGAICNDAGSKPAPSNGDYMQQDIKPVFSTDAPVGSAPIFGGEEENSEFSWSMPKADLEEDVPFAPIIAGLEEEDDELVLPDSIKFNDADNSSYPKKSISYEDTVKIECAAKADKKPINQIIPESFKEMVMPPKIVEVTAVASGTVTSKDELPPLKDGQMYVGITHKQLRRLKSRSFRGLGVLCTLCLMIISAFCIWNYVHSFADPLVGRWKGNVESQDIPIEVIQQLDTEKFDSTWEFSDGGSMYLNLLINDTPVSLGGTYEQKSDEKGEQYLSITLNNPMDGVDYTFEMYYTVTGDVLVLNDMQGLGMTIDLVKE